MAFFDQLKNASLDESNLDRFIANHSVQIIDLFSNVSYSDLKEKRNDLKEYLENPKYLKTIKSLDLSKDINASFIFSLLECCSSYNFPFPFKQLFNLCKKRDIIVGSKVIADSIYMTNRSRWSSILKSINEFVEALKIYIDEEGGTIEESTNSLLKLYKTVVRNCAEFNMPLVQEIIDEIKRITLGDSGYLFDQPFVKEIISIPIDDFQNTYENIQLKLDEYLGRNKTWGDFSIETKLIEKGTTYSNSLKEIQDINFDSIKNLSVSFHDDPTSEIFYSLKRGVGVYTKEEQLFCYMYSFGNMHKAKLNSAFSSLPAEINGKDIEAIDWGAGQGLGTMLLAEHSTNYSNNINIKKSFLIEPSTIAIERAALHLNAYGLNNIITINKDIDSLISSDINIDNGLIKLHLFSNILDVEFFSLPKLITLIENISKGINYFIIVSPRINDSRAFRIDSFVQHFIANHGASIEYQIDNISGTWVRGWSRMIRIIKVEIR